MERAACCAGENSPSLHVHLGNYWVFRSKTANPAQPEWERVWAKARRHYKKAQGLEGGKRLAEKMVNYVWRYYPDREFISKVLLIENRGLVQQIK